MLWFDEPAGASWWISRDVALDVGEFADPAVGLLASGGPGVFHGMEVPAR